MQLKTISNTEGDSTYSFPIDGRSNKEVKEMKEYGFMELARFKGANKPRTDGYFCGACKQWSKQEFTMPDKASTHDGVCMKYKFRTRDFGACCGFEPKQGLFSYNPA